MTRVIAAGECMVEFRPEADGRFSRNFAGDAYNTAVYLKRSAPDFEVDFLTATGDDAVSTAMRQAWRREGISERLAYVVPGAQPGLYLIETDRTGDRRFHYWRKDSAARQWLRLALAHGSVSLFQGVDLIYLSGISLAILSADDRRNAIQLMKEARRPIAFDPNVRLSLWQSKDEARETIEAMFAIADILLPSRQDLEIIYGISEVEQQLRRLQELGAKEIALTTDETGCIVWTDGLSVALPGQPPTRVLDTSGAGDSFNGAYLAARSKGVSATDAARDGLRLAAKVVAEPGAIVAVG